jgi:hypothetical protein
MKNMDRNKAALAISVCDQIEAALKNNDEVMIEQYKQWLQDWARDVETTDLIVFVQSIRARALQILEEEDEHASAED